MGRTTSTTWCRARSPSSGCWRWRRARSGRPTSRASCGALWEALDELERCVRDLAPAAVDRQRVSTAGDLDELSHARVVLLLLVGGVAERMRHRVVLLAADDQQRPTVR